MRRISRGALEEKVGGGKNGNLHGQKKKWHGCLGGEIAEVFKRIIIKRKKVRNIPV